ncbi:MAG: aspartate kinase [Desulfobacterales bacterium]
MKVIKIGGGCLKGKKNIEKIVELIADRGQGHIFVVSALNGITDFLLDRMSAALESDENIPQIIGYLNNKHMLIARYLMHKGDTQKTFKRDLSKSLSQLERLYYGLSFTRESTPRIRDIISSFGERFSALLLTSALRSKGVQAACRMPEKIGLMTDGKFGDATVNLRKTTQNFQRNLKPLMKRNVVLFIPGFFGVSEEGDITTFGRGGSDYSAAVVAAAMKAEILEVWKDVDGYMSADPNVVPEARLIPRLSYDEAAELSYFGAKILHPRTVEPLRSCRVNIAVKNTLNPDATGSLITARNLKSKSIIKSVAHDSDIGVIKVHASGVGARPGILSLIAKQISDNGINIKSVVTSQTCISLLLALKDIEPGSYALKAIYPRPYRRLEKIEDVSLISIVGAGLMLSKGIAAKCFSAAAECGVNVEMISFGPSPVALYFLVRNRDLHCALNAIHGKFFPNQMNPWEEV